MSVPFRLLFTQGQGFMSRFVRWFCRSKYLSHTVGSFKIFNADVILEASPDGVKFVPAKYFAQHNSIEAVIVPISGPLNHQEGMERQLTWLVDNYGDASYDWMAAGSIGIINRFKWLWEVIGLWVVRKWNKKNVHCTEIWVRLLQRAGYRAVKGVMPELSDPLRLVKLLSEASTEFVVEKINPGLKKEVDKL